jgi:glycosyltransferase 2 family protein
VRYGTAQRPKPRVARTPASLLSLLNYGIRILRWRSYLVCLGHPLPHRFCASTYVAGFAFTLSPAKIGEMVRARYYLPLGVPLAHVTASFFAERLMDILAMSVLAAAFIAVLHPAALVGIGVAFALMLVALATIPWQQLATVLRDWSHLPRPLRETLSALVLALASTRPLLQTRTLAMGFSLGLLAWSLEGVGLFVLASMFPFHLGLATAVGIYGVAVLVGGISFLPGGLGTTEAAMTAMLVSHGWSTPPALLLTLACRLVTLWLAVGLGWLAVMLLRQRSPAEVVA